MFLIGPVIIARPASGAPSAVLQSRAAHQCMPAQLGAG
jgi:hypothetical protein